MRVDLRGGKARMPEHLLNAAQIGAPVEQIGCKGMAHIVRRKRLVEPGCAHGLLEHLAHGVGAHLVAARRHEKIRGCSVAQEQRARIIQIALHRIDAKLVQRDYPLLPALAENLHLALSEVDVAQLQVRSLRDACTASVQEFENRLIAHVGGDVPGRIRRTRAGRTAVLAAGQRRARDGMNAQQLNHVVWAYDMRQMLVLFGTLKNACGVGGDNAGRVQPAEKTAQRRQMPVYRGSLVARFVQIGQESAQVAMIRP